MEKDLEKIVKRIIGTIRDETIIDIRHIHNNSFGLVIEYYSLENGRNYTISLSDICMILENGIKLLEEQK